MNKALHDRINRVINTDAFEQALERDGLTVFEFQTQWAVAGSFDKLPAEFQNAIAAGEAELSEPLAQLV